MIAGTCPTAERWLQHLRGSLSPEDAAELGAHLDECSACQKTLENLSAQPDSLLDVARAVGQEPRTEETALREAIGALQADTTPDDQATQPPTPTVSSGAAEFAYLGPPAQAGHLGRLAHYEILGVLGRGGMGVVFRAHDEKLNRIVAIKVLASQYAASEPARKRFEREAKTAAQVSHDHVVPIYHVDECNGVAYLVMPLIVGTSLQDRIDKSGPLELKEILRIGQQIAAGLAAAHRQGLVHRDIKPANILLESVGAGSVSDGSTPSLTLPAQTDCRVKITDFGLARAVDDASLSQSGMLAGTPMYMSPEQARGGTVDHRSDLFSLGSVLYAMATGEPPFKATGTVAVIMRVCEEEPTPIRQLNPDIPEWLEAIVAKLHAKRPWERFASATDVAELLGQHLAHLEAPNQVAQPAMVARPQRPRKRSSAALVGVVLVVVGVFVLALVAVPGVLLLGGSFWLLASRAPQANDAMPQADDAIGKESMRTRPDRVQQFNWGEFEDPAGDCDVRDDPDRFTMILPPGKRELFPGQDSNFDAPRLLRDVDGDFSAVVKVQPFELKGNAAADLPGSPLQAAGLVVWVNKQNYLRFLITRTPKDAGPSLRQQAYLFEGNFMQEKMGELAADQRYLNLKREGRTFKIRWGADGKKWSDFISFEEVEFPRQLKVGLLAVNVSNDGFAPEFMEFRIDSFPSKEAEKGPAKGGVK